MGRPFKMKPSKTAKHRPAAVATRKAKTVARRQKRQDRIRGAIERTAAFQKEIDPSRR